MTNERPKTVGFPLVFDKFSTRCPFVIKVACAKGWIAPRSEEESATNALKLRRRQKPRFEENAAAKPLRFLIGIYRFAEDCM